ncbi:protease SohB [Legionella impletisoli]|uniref:Protease n=1 Tax=Legionella impletisoli TaxID=343510 RepID=A0A917NAT1_9GAMM|nr:protease SohB [Legionella impletisoli]GGI78806.1 protease [Legionella impletisoli]
MEFLAQYGLFALELFTVVIAILLLIAGILSMGRKPRPKLEIKSLNKHWKDIKETMQKEILHEKPKKTKSKQKKEKKTQPALYVLDFAGDIKASQVEQFREEISAVLSVAEDGDEVVVRLESPGGAVNGYGLAASQLHRIRDRNIPLTICIDKVAASGGYLMACVANRIVAAPFAIIGSIGVVAQIPNFYRWLKKRDIDIELMTAGEYKRTLTLFAENTEKGRKKFQQELEVIHQSFRDYVLDNRQQLDIEKVATGEHWLAQDAFELRLVDLLKTSDEYIMDKLNEFNVYSIKIHGKQSLAEKILKPAMSILHPWG